MNKNNFPLKEGQEIKNYKKLCEIFGVEAKGGNGKIAHKKELQRYCTFHTQGQKYIIDEVYETPKEKDDGRVNNGGHIAHTIYEDLMDNLILDLLSKEQIDSLSFHELFQDIIPLFKQEYSVLQKEGYEYYAKRNGMSKGLVLTYSQKLKEIVTKCFETSLNRLERNGIIIWSKDIMINDALKGEILVYKDSDIYHTIKGFENIVLEEMGITHYNRTNPKVNKKFKKKVCKILYDENKLEIYPISYWNVYTIELIDETVEGREFATDIDELILRFKNSVINAVANKASKNDFGIEFYPYQASTHVQDTLILNDLMWVDTVEDISEAEEEYGEEENIPF